MNQSRVKFIFVSLAVVAIGQVIWWAHLLTSLQHRVAAILNTPSAAEEASRFEFMIYSEGLFFISVWSLAMWSAFRFSQEQGILRRSHADFLSAVTHELKTPLANIRLSLDTLERPNLGEEMRAKYIQRAQSAVDRLLTEIEEILLLGKSDRSTSGVANLNLRELIETCLLNLGISATGDSAISIVVEKSIHVSAPAEEARLVIQSILDNALKYSRAAQTEGHISSALVEIFAREESGGIVLEIRDNGFGFTEKDLKKAFEPFWRADWATNLAQPGTGLGLALAKNLSARAGFRLELQSEGHLKGSTASIRFRRNS